MLLYFFREMNNDNSLDPLCFILVKSGAHGGKLLFKYPFNNHTEVHNESVHCNCSGGNPYRLTLSEDLLNQVRALSNHRPVFRSRDLY